MVVLITDGEDHESFPLKAAAQLNEDHIKVVAIGLGDPDEGARVPRSAGTTSYVTHEGQVVWSRLDESTLREIALKTGGAYIPAKTQAYDLGEVYRNHIQKLEQEEATGKKRKRFHDRFHLFLWPALILLLLDAWLAFYPRRREGRNA